MQVVIAVLGLLGQVALMPARTKLSDVSTGTTARSIAQSDLVPTQHTCAVPEGATAAEVCPGLTTEGRADREWQLQVPAGARWLFYGPSYMGEIFAAVIAANKDQIARIENLANSAFARELTANYTTLPHCDENKTVVPCCGRPGRELTCNVVGSETACVNAPVGANRITLTNGAVLVGVNNQAALQEESAAQRIANAFRGLSLDHMFYMHPHNWQPSGKYRGAWGLCIHGDEPPSNLAKRLESERGDPAAADDLSKDMCTGGYGNESIPGAAYIDCVERSALWPLLRRVARSATLVAPFNVAAGQAELGGTHTRVPVYYTQRQSDRSRCECYAGDDLPTGLASRDYTRSHQCIVLYEPASETYFGGSVMDMAEDLLQSVVSRRAETIAAL